MKAAVQPHMVTEGVAPAGARLGGPAGAASLHVANAAPGQALQHGHGRIAVEIAATRDGQAPEWLLLFPAGDVMRADTQQLVRLVDAPLVASVSMQRQIKPVVDFNHQTDFALYNGSQAPAAGWVEELQERAGAVWARIDWTAAGRAALAAREYRYISPTYLADGAGNVTAILRAGLCNDPALVFRPLVAAQLAGGRQPSGDDNVDHLIQVATALALGTDAKPDAVVAAATAAQSAVAIVIGVRKALGLSETADGAMIASKIAEMHTAAHGSDDVIKSLTTRLNTLEAGIATNTATGKVDAAVAAKKLAPAQRDWAIGYASRDPAGFDTFLAAQPQIVVDRAMPPGSPPNAGGQLTAAEAQVAAQMGLKPEEVVAGRRVADA